MKYNCYALKLTDKDGQTMVAAIQDDTLLQIPCSLYDLTPTFVTSGKAEIYLRHKKVLVAMQKAGFIIEVVDYRRELLEFYNKPKIRMSHMVVILMRALAQLAREGNPRNAHHRLMTEISVYEYVLRTRWKLSRFIKLLNIELMPKKPKKEVGINE